MDPTLAFSVATVPAIVGLIQIAKDAGLPDRLAPVAAIILGAGAQALQVMAGHSHLAQAMVTGIGVGLAAGGLYSGTRAVGQKTGGSQNVQGVDRGYSRAVRRDFAPRVNYNDAVLRNSPWVDQQQRERDDAPHQQ